MIHHSELLPWPLWLVVLESLVALATLLTDFEQDNFFAFKILLGGLLCFEAFATIVT